MPGGMDAIGSRRHPIIGAYRQKMVNSNHLVGGVTPP